MFDNQFLNWHVHLYFDNDYNPEVSVVGVTMRYGAAAFWFLWQHHFPIRLILFFLSIYVSNIFHLFSLIKVHVCAICFLISENLTTISKRLYKAFLFNFILSIINNYYLPRHVITYVCTNLGEDRN